MIDTGRNFLTTTTIKMTLDAMAYTKLNVLHWHMTDDQSFPIVSETLPHLASAGAFSPRHTYSKKDVAGVVRYARERGIAVLPEFDMPGHSTSWQKGYPSLTTRCSNASKLGFTKPMDVTINSTYTLIESLLR